jgi:hypothetical protein
MRTNYIALMLVLEIMGTSFAVNSIQLNELSGI